MMKGLASLLLVAVWVCCGVEYGSSSRAPVSARFPLGAIGCLFITRICGPGQECVDDRLFGTCQDRGDPKEFGEYPLDRETLEDLETQILVLVEDGFSWRDAYTQCMLQNILVYGQLESFDNALCSSESPWAQNTEDDISKVLEKLFYYYASPSGRPADLSSIDSAAALEYVPDLGSQKRDEFLKIHKYFDPSKSNWKRRVEESSESAAPTFQDYLVENEVENVLRDAKDEPIDYDYLSDDDVTKLRLYLEALQEAARISDNNNNNRDEDSDYMEKDASDLDSEYPTSEEAGKDDSVGVEGAAVPESGNEGAFWSSPGIEYQTSPGEDGTWQDGEKPLPGIDLSILETDSPDNTLSAFPGQQEDTPTQPEVANQDVDGEETANQIAEIGLTPHYAKLLADLLQNDIDPSKLSNKDLDQLTRLIGTLLKNLGEEDGSLMPEGAGAEDMAHGDSPGSQGPALVQSPPSEDGPSGDGEEEKAPVKKADAPMSYDVPSKGGDPDSEADKSSDGEKKPAEALGVVDATFVYVTVDKDASLEEGKKLVGSLERVLGIPPQSLTVTDVRDGRVTFRISPELLKVFNASSIAKAAGSKKGDIARLTGLNIVSAGIGSQDGEVKIEVLGDDGNSPKFFVLTFVLCGCIAGVLIAVVVIYLVKRHSRSKDKLAQLASEGIGAEASQDYQDLCRQRMQSKTSEKPEPLHAAGRIGSVSESQVRSPSSRSSTSSWSEEPVTSNMDISTGHIVLSYMEDHLKNKGRLDQEWEALAAYEADPCSTLVASDPSNTRKNRYADNLPYDHSRVVLADASNVSGSDYINASTITDHDPRNPAYIATQGPLPHTVADFWQMVWEQGSVVIVMLTKLTENGVAMCHRYWPEEGSDLYHIYEVHLVSEHIWCDDYLVRSFYLKNLQTNETRTVTQFHFLTWQDNKVPGSVKALLDFRRKVNKSYRGRSCPIVVHCSDGAGRSGTYTLIDMVLNRLAKGAKEIDIAATLEHIRDQRMGMVKTKEQFEFALAAVAEEVHAILKSLPQ